MLHFGKLKSELVIKIEDFQSNDLLKFVADGHDDLARVVAAPRGVSRPTDRHSNLRFRYSSREEGGRNRLLTRSLAGRSL